MLKKFLYATTLVTLSAGIVTAADWQADPAHSSIGFSVRHMVISNVKGNFNSFEGKADFDPKDLSKGKAEFTVDVASINTENERRDNHLKSADFFDTEKYPKITFKSTGISDVQENNFKMTGDLTIKDVTKPVTFDCVYNGAIKDGRGNQHAGFSANTKINRMDYNILWNKAIETGGFVVGDEVAIDLELEMILPAEGE